MNESFAAVPGLEKSMNGVGEFIVMPFLLTDVPVPVAVESFTSKDCPTMVKSLLSIVFAPVMS